MDIYGIYVKKSTIVLVVAIFVLVSLIYIKFTSPEMADEFTIKAKTGDTVTIAIDPSRNHTLMKTKDNTIGVVKEETVYLGKEKTVYLGVVLVDRQTYEYELAQTRKIPKKDCIISEETTYSGQKYIRVAEVTNSSFYENYLESTEYFMWLEESNTGVIGVSVEAIVADEAFNLLTFTLER